MFRMRTIYFGVSLKFLVHVSLFWIRFLNSFTSTHNLPTLLKGRSFLSSLRRTCCRQTPSPLDHNLWLLLWGRREKCNQVQNSSTSLWGARHPISKQTLKSPYGISFSIWSNKEQENPAANTCRVLLLPVGLGRALSLSRCSPLHRAWAVGSFSTLGVLLHFVIIILTKKLAAWSIWGEYGFETDVEIIWKHEDQAVEHFQDYMKH